MQTNDGALLFQVRADQSQIQRDIEAIKKQFEQMTNKAVEEGKKQANVWQNLLKGATAYFTLQGAQSFISQMIAVRSQFQQLEISFGTMLKSKEKANALMAQMADLASKTPFGLEEVSEGAKRLLAFQVPAEEVTETLRRMGDVASGLGVPMGQLIHVYGQVKAQGKLMTNDLYQFMNAGIPIIAELSKVVGKSETEIKEMVSAGKIGFPEVQAVIKNMTDEGGLFFNLMAEQSKSLGGQISNLKDNFDQMLNEIGKSSEGIVSGAIKGVSFLVENYQTLGKIIAGLIVTYGTYKTAIIVHNALIALNTQLTNGWTIAQLAQYRGLLLLEKAQKLLNATMLANPYVLVATAVVGLGVALWTLKDNTNLAQKAQEDYNKEKEQIIDNEKAHKQRIDELIESVNNQALADTDRQKALIALQKEYPKIFEKYDIETLKLADILKLKKEIAKIDEEKGKESRKNSQQRYKNNADTLLKIGKGEIKGGFDAIVKNSDLDKDISKAFGKYWRYNPMLDFREIYQYFVEKEKVAKNDVKGDAVASWASNLKNLSEEQVKKELEHRQKLIADLQKQKKAGNKWASHGVNFGGDWFAFNEEELQAQSKTLQAQLDRLHEKKYEYKDLTKEYTQAVKDAEKALDNIRNGGLGKLEKEELAKAIKEAEENLKNAKKALEDHKTSLNKKAPATSKKEQSFDQEAHLLQTQRIAIDNELAEQKKGVDVLQDGYDKELALIQYFYDEKAEAIRRGGEDARIALEKERANSKGLMSNETYNARLNAINENEMIANEQNNALKTQQEQKLFTNLLKEYESYEEKKEGIIKKYQERTEIIQNNVKDEAKRKQILSKLDKDKKKDLDMLKIENKENTEVFKTLFSDFSMYSRDELTKVLEESKIALKELQENLDFSNPENITYIKNLIDQIERLEQNVNGKTSVFERLSKNFNIITSDTADEYSKNKARSNITMDFGDLSNQMGGISQMFEKLGNDIESSLLKAFAKITDGLQKATQGLSQAFDTSQSKGSRIANGIGAGVGFVVDMIGSISANRKERERAEAQDKKELLNFQRDYNVALNEELRLRTELSSSGLTSQYVNRIKDGLTAWHDATNKQQEEIRNLMNKGQVKKGSRNVVDWGAVGSDTLKGLGAGAAIGSMFTPIGTVIGAAVGAVVGFVGGLFKKKRKQEWSGIMSEFPELIQRADNGLLKVNQKLLDSLKANNRLNDETLNIINNIEKWNEQIEKAKKQISQVVDEITSGLGDSVRKNLVDSFKAGEDAIQSLRKTFSALVEDMTSKILMDVLFEPAFKKFKENAISSYDIGGDQNMVDDIAELYHKIIEQRQKFNDALKAANIEGKKLGLDVFDVSPQRQAVEKGFARMTQDAGEELNGRFTLMTALEKQTVDSIKEMHQSFVSLSEKQLRHLANIDTNTYQLHQVKDDVSGMKKDISGMKTILGNIETKGIKIRS